MAATTCVDFPATQCRFLEKAVIQLLSYFLIKAMLWCLSLMPLPMVHAIATAWGRLLYLLPTKARDTTCKNLHHCFPDNDADDIQQLILASLINTACTVLEMGKAWLAPADTMLSLVVSEQGYEEFQRAVQSDAGVILLAPHLGNWEIFGFHACQGLASSFMYQPPRIAGLDRLLREVRSRTGIRLAPTSRKGIAELLLALKHGELVGILPDQVPNNANGVFAPFYGQPAFTMTLVSRLVQRTGARVFCGYAERLPGGQGFNAVFLSADSAIYSEDLLESVTALNRCVEMAVDGALTQYQWEYKRFRRQPDNSEFYRVNRLTPGK
ncbi:MAG: lipid A biosynthesis acyltransferase [Gammaproteobacteria bacterium]|nr:lipid A biosynthesis acyltransferase [Gammaproteobacteria bacterium]